MRIDPHDDLHVVLVDHSSGISTDDLHPPDAVLVEQPKIAREPLQQVIGGTLLEPAGCVGVKIAVEDP